VQKLHATVLSTMPQATKCPLRYSALPYCIGCPSRSVTQPPAASSTAWPAAVSHSIVGARRGYTSASPSATAQNLSDDPEGLSSEMVCRSIHCLVAGSRCERLTTTRHPAAGGRLT